MSAIHEQNCRVWSGYDCTCSITNQQLMAAKARIRELEQEKAHLSAVANMLRADDWNNSQAQLQAVTKLYDGSQEHIEQLAKQLQAVTQEREAVKKENVWLLEMFRHRALTSEGWFAQWQQLQAHNRELITALERATKILKAWADNDVVSDDTLMEMTDEVIPLCDAALSRIPKEPTE